MGWKTCKNTLNKEIAVGREKNDELCVLYMARAREAGLTMKDLMPLYQKMVQEHYDSMSTTDNPVAWAVMQLVHGHKTAELDELLTRKGIIVNGTVLEPGQRWMIDNGDRHRHVTITELCADGSIEACWGSISIKIEPRMLIKLLLPDGEGYGGHDNAEGN